MKIFNKIISAFLTLVMCISVFPSVIEAEETEIYSLSLSGKTLEDLGDAVSFSSTNANPGTMAPCITAWKGLAVTKSSTGSGYASDVAGYIYLRKPIEEYSEETRAESYQQGFKGKLKISVGFYLSAVRPAWIELHGKNSTSNDISLVRVRTDNGNIRIDGTGTLKKTTTLNHTLTFELDTAVNSSLKVTLAEAADNTLTHATTALGEDFEVTGIKYGFYNYSSSGYISVSSYTVTAIDGIAAEDVALDEAVRALTSGALCAAPENVTSDISLPGQINGYDITWSSSDENIIDADGKVTLPEDSAVDVWMTANISQNGYERIKRFKLTVPRDPTIPPRLEAPGKPVWSGAVLSWDESKDAQSYTVNIYYRNNWLYTSRSLSDTSIDLSSILTESGWYRASVTASAVGYRESPESEVSDGKRIIGESEELIYEETFDGKTLDDISDLVTLTLSNDDKGTVYVEDGRLTLEKLVTGSGYGANVAARFDIEKIIEAYTDEIRSESKQSAFKGKYLLETVISTNKKTLASMTFGGKNGTNENKSFGVNIDFGYDCVDIYSHKKLASYTDYSREFLIGVEFDTTDQYSLGINLDGGEPYYLSNIAFGEDFRFTSINLAYKSMSSADSKLFLDSVRLYKLSDSEDSESLKTAAASLTVSDLTDDAENVISDITLPSEINGAKISWTSSDIEYISNSGKLMKRSLDKDIDVWMTAVISNNYHEIEKSFKLTVPKNTTPDDVLKAASDELEYSDLIDGNPNNLNENIRTPSEGRYGTTIIWKSSDTSYIADDGTVLKHDETSKKEVQLTATFSYGGETLTKVFKFMLSVPFEPEHTFYEISGAGIPEKIYPQYGGRKFELNNMLVAMDIALKDSYTGEEKIMLCDPDGNAALSLSLSESDGKTEGFGRMCTVTGNNAVGEEISESILIDDNAESFVISCHMNYYDSEVTVTADGENLINITKVMNNAGSLSYVSCNADLNSIKFMMTKAEALELILNQGGYLYDVESIGGIVRRDIELPSHSIGNVSVKWISSNENALSSGGKIASDTLKADTDVTLQARVTISDYPDISLVRKFMLTVKFKDFSNLALDCDANSNVNSTAEHFPAKAADGFFDTWWQTAKKGSGASLIIDLGEEKAFNNAVIKEAQLNGRYSVTGWSLKVSSDKNVWEEIASGTSLGESQKSLTFTTVKARYLKLETVCDNSAVGISELQVYAELSDTEKAEFDLRMLKSDLGSLRGLTKSIDFPLTGSSWGSKLSYSSSNEGVLTDKGEVTRKSDTESGILTVTATIGGAQARLEIPFTVSGNSSSSSLGGGSSKGSSYSGSVGVVEIPKSDMQTFDMDIFADVPSTHWAYSYIMRLKSLGIVSGDGSLYRPEDSVTREEFLKLIIEALGIASDGNTAFSFEDVSKNTWYYDYVLIGVNSGIVKGMSDEWFGAGEKITREDMTVMCIRALECIKKEPEIKNKAVEFSDSSEISAYAAESVKLVQTSGIIEGYPDGSFKPKNNATRAEAAKIINEISR